MNDSTVCAGLLRTKSPSDLIKSSFSAYSSGVKHQGKMDRIIISGTLSSALAMTCQLSITVLMKGSVLVQPLCSDKDLTRSGYLAPSHMPTPAPRDKPDICAFSIFSACM